MKSRAIILTLALCVAVVAASAEVQTTQPAPAEKTQYVGMVTGTDVYVRCNGSMTAYPCTKVSRPARVTVVGEPISGWLRILPPPGVFSAIAKEFVQADPGGTKGVIAGDRVWVRAGGDLRHQDFEGLQKQANRGEEVQILGQIGEYYKIVPPEGVYFYISARYVRPVSEAPAVDQPAPATPVTPAAPAAPAPAPTVLERIPSREGVTTAIADFQALEAALKGEINKPADQRDLKALQGKFMALKVPAETRLQPYIDYYVQYLEAVMSGQAKLKKFDELAKDCVEQQKLFEMKRAALEVILPPKDNMVRYSAVGVLTPSAIYVGSGRAPKRYAVRDAVTGAITAYAQSTTGEVELQDYVGKLVGLLGPSKFDPELRITIVEVEHPVLLAERPGMPASPSATVKNMPQAPWEKSKLEPKATPTTAPAVELKAAPARTPEPQPKPTSRPIVEAKPAPKPPAGQPTSAPAVTKPLPATGLPVVAPTSQPIDLIGEQEYD